MGPRTLLAPFTVRGEHFRTADDGRVVCEQCPRACRLHDGQRGFCFVREAQAGQVVLTSYGRASGFCVDPIEKKPLYHFLPGSSVLSFGTAGCNLGCKFCQNWDISKARDDDRLTDTASPEAVAHAAASTGVRSLAFTYNDPVIFAEYASDCAEAAHQRGIATVAVTAGYVSGAARASFFRHIDAANVDLKAFDPEFYRTLCFAELGPVLDTLVYLRRETRVWLEVTTLLIPGHNDTRAELERLCAWYADALGPLVPLHFSAFHPDFKLHNAPPTPRDTLSQAREIAIAHGLRHVYTGNVRDLAGARTHCSGCGAVLITRDGYAITGYGLDEGGHCRSCGTALAGVFDRGAGAWGNRRMRLPIHEGSEP